MCKNYYHFLSTGSDIDTSLLSLSCVSNLKTHHLLIILILLNKIYAAAWPFDDHEINGFTLRAHYTIRHHPFIN